MQIQRAGVGHFAAPNPFVERFAVQRRAAVSHKLFKQTKLPRGQFNRAPVLGDPPAHNVKSDIERLQGLPAAAGTAQHRPHPRKQLFHLKRLDKVVVRTKLQAAHTVFCRGFGRDKNDRRTKRAQVVKQFITIQPRQHDVEQRNVKIIFRDQISRRQPIVRNGAVVAGTQQADLHQTGDGGFVLHNQDAVHIRYPLSYFLLLFCPLLYPAFVPELYQNLPVGGAPAADSRHRIQMAHKVPLYSHPYCRRSTKKAPGGGLFSYPCSALRSAAVSWF